MTVCTPKARYLLTCYKHRLLLLPHCPHCFRRIPSQRLDPTSCPFCRHPYASTATQRIALEAMGLHSGDQLTDAVPLAFFLLLTTYLFPWTSPTHVPSYHLRNILPFYALFV